MIFLARSVVLGVTGFQRIVLPMINRVHIRTLKGGIYREQIITEMYDIAADNDSEEDRSHPIPELPHWHHES